MWEARSRQATSAALVLALAVACGGKFESGGQNTGGAGGSSASSGAAGNGGSGTGASGGASGSNGRGGNSGSAGSSGSGGAGGSGGSGAVGGSGAAGGSGGSGAVSGSGGSGGGPCVVGAACSPEGATCSENSCCPCQYKCTSGRWQIHLCPSCPAPYCQDPAPANGAPCDACFTPTNGCTYDGCPSAPKVFARCDRDRWSVQVVPCAGGCCTDDGQCGASYVCASTVCKPKVSDGCWRDAECGPGNFCSGAFVCSCNADCSYQDRMGQCVPNNAGCCRNDEGCMTGNECVAGVCKLKLAAGSCWSNRDCSNGTTCRNAQVCPCGAACLLPDVMGQCG